jgi:multiple sugar transport system substrate-binding protein
MCRSIQQGDELMRRLSRREFLKTAGVAAVGLGLAACGQAAPTSPDTGTGSGAPAADKVVLQQWYHEYGEEGCQEAVYRIADEYNASQDKIKVEVTWAPGDYDAKLNSALAAGTGPDVYESGLNIDRMRNKYVVALDDLYTPEVKADFDDKDLQYNTLEGKVWGVRMIIDTGLMYYRKSMFEEAGVAIPTTFDELVAAGEKLTTGRVKGIFLGNDGGGIMSDIGAYAAGVNFISANNELQFNTPVLANSWMKAKELHESGSLLTGSPQDWWDPSAFVQGLCASCWGGFWMMPEVTRQLGDDFVVTQFPPMQVPNGTARGSTFWGGWVEFINGHSKHIDDAKTFVKWQWIDNIEWQNEWNTAYGYHIPPRKSAAEANKEFDAGNAKIAKDGLYKHGWANGPMWTGAMGTAVGDAYWRVLRENANAADEIEKAYNTCKDELARQLAG